MNGMSKETWGPFLPEVSSGGNGERSDEELLAEVLRKLSLEWVREHNNRPLDELGGLTPLQAHRLMYREVGDPACPLRLADDLSEEEAGSSTLFRNARLFLATVDEMGGAKATQAGNLQRGFVAAMLPRLGMAEWKREVIEGFKVVNEADVGPLHRVRVLCEVGRLLSKRKGRFRLTRQAKGLLAGPSGTFYRHLFFTYFYRYNIFYWWWGKEYPEIQAFINFGLYRLGQLCRRWQSPKRITEEVYVKGLRMEGEEESEPYPYLEWAVESTFLGPLTEFGLLERRCEKGERLSDNHRYRVTGLFDRFLIFEWRS
jgi:hypothetical protein